MAIVFVAIDRDTVSRAAAIPRVDLSIPDAAGAQYNVTVYARLLDERLTARAHRAGVTYTIGVHSDGQIQNTRTVDARPDGIVRIQFGQAVRNYLAGLNPPIRWAIQAELNGNTRWIIDPQSRINMYDGTQDDPPQDAT